MQQKEKWGEEWWQNRKTAENVENTGKEEEPGENIEKHDENRANQGKTQKNI